MLRLQALHFGVHVYVCVHVFCAYLPSCECLYVGHMHGCVSILSIPLCVSICICLYVNVALCVHLHILNAVLYVLSGP